MHRPVTYTTALRVLHDSHCEDQQVGDQTRSLLRKRAMLGKMWLQRLTRRLTKVQVVLGLGLCVAVVVLVKQINDSSQLDTEDAAVYRQMSLKSNYLYDGEGGAAGGVGNAPADYVFYNKNVPLVWVGGVPRSGTTLARAMLDAHPDIRCGEETRVIPRILGMHAQMMKSPLEATRLQEAKITEDVLNDALGAYILSIISKHGELAKRLCNKDPFALRSIARIAKIFPRSKFVLMVRDGRATIHSIISRKVTIKGFDSHSYRGAIQDWNRAIENMYNQCESVGPDHCLPVHYEDLVLHPEREMKRVLAFLGMPWNDLVLHHEKTIGQAGGVSLSKLTDWNAEPGSTAVDPRYSVIVLRRSTVADDVFLYGIIILAFILYIGFGCKIDLKVIWQILKRPISPAIGFCCQFILMPLLGFGISRMFSLSDELSFGLLAMASSPGGGSSNVWISLLGGHLDLSLTMTTISTFGSLAMMPLWMFLLGRFFVDPTRMSIPFMELFRSLLTIVIPCAVGLGLQRFLPKVAKRIANFTIPFSGIFVIYILTVGTYANLYMYIIMGEQPKVIGAAILLPAFGYGIAFFLPLLLRRAKKDAVAISIETGIQNSSVPIIMLQGNFQQPEGDIAAVMPVATSLFTQLPIMFVWLGLVIYRRCKSETDVMHSDDVEMEEEKKEPIGDMVQTVRVVGDNDFRGKHMVGKGMMEKGEVEKGIVDQVNDPGNGTEKSQRF